MSVKGTLERIKREIENNSFIIKRLIVWSKTNYLLSERIYSDLKIISEESNISRESAFWF